MIIKCGKDEITLNEESRIKFNGKIYQIVTAKLEHGKSYPIIAKAKAEKLIKEGTLIEHSRENTHGIDCIIYRERKVGIISADYTKGSPSTYKGIVVVVEGVEILRSNTGDFMKDWVEINNNKTIQQYGLKIDWSIQDYSKETNAAGFPE